jgi:hypothetical protein
MSYKLNEIFKVKEMGEEYSMHMRHKKCIEDFSWKSFRKETLGRPR